MKPAAPWGHAVIEANMPLAGHESEVPCSRKYLRKGDALLIKMPTIPGCSLVIRHPTHSGLVRIETGQQSGPRRTATTRVVKLRKLDPPLCQCIEMRCRNLTSVRPDVRKAHVVDKNHNDIGTLKAFD